jgi:hypothetical protein
MDTDVLVSLNASHTVGGIVPENRFECKFNTFKLDNMINDSGIDPDNILLFNCNTRNELVISENDDDDVSLVGVNILLSVVVDDDALTIVVLYLTNK